MDPYLVGDLDAGLEDGECRRYNVHPRHERRGHGALGSYHTPSGFCQTSTGLQESLG